MFGRLREEFRRKFAGRTLRDFTEDWKWIMGFTRRRKGAVIAYAFFGLLSATFSLAAAYAGRIVINIVTQKQTDRIVFLVCTLVLTSVGAIVLSNINKRIAAKLDADVHNDIQALIFTRVMDVKWAELNKYKKGDLLNRFTDDVDTVSANAVSWIPNILVTVYSFVLTLIVLIRMDPVIALIVFATAPVLALLSRVVLQKQRKYRKRVLENKSDIVSFSAEAFYHLDTVKAFGVCGGLKEKLRARQAEYKEAALEYNRFSIKTGAGVSALCAVAEWGTYAWCVYRLWTGHILYGDMTFFISQHRRMKNRLDTLMIRIPEMLNAAVSARRIREIIDLPAEKRDPEAYAAVAGKPLTLEMNDVTFAYREGCPVYEHADFRVAPGETVAVLGESGAGKTTLFRLLLGLAEPQHGEVLLRDGDGNAVPMSADLRQAIAYVPQGNTVLQGTVAENMRMTKQNATDAEIVDALKTACAWEYIEPLGLDAELGESGRGLSEGQLQRISIARALLRNAPVLFLDEATSALDEITESRVVESIRQRNRDRAVIVCTHRPAVLPVCGRIYRIKGRTLEEETPARGGDTV